MLSASAVSKVWPSGLEALAAINVTLDSGEIAALIGGSGCGKTTLLRLIAGLETASSGAIRIDGRLVNGPDPAVGIIFQEPRLLPWLTVAENVKFGIANLPRDEQDSRAGELLARLGLSEHAERWPRELSGGQAQRVAVARALATRPQVLLLDEPFSALDAFTRAALHAELLALWAVHRPTLLMVTHDVDEAVLLADRILVMEPNPGRIFAQLSIQRPRPRDPLSPAFLADKRRAMAALDASLAGTRLATAR